tara:strand:+ start:1867 stop:2166 length:300 start_codon:yes stop_codon:yes gene_type:complete
MLSTTPSETSGGTGTAPVEIPPILCHIRTMNKTQAIEILSTAFGGSYTGTEVVPACSGNLIQDIMNEGSEGKTYHRWECQPLPRCVEDSQLIAVAQHYV